MEIEHRTPKDKWTRDRARYDMNVHGDHSVENIVMYYNITNIDVSMVNLPFNAGRNNGNILPRPWQEQMQSEKGNEWQQEQKHHRKIDNSMACSHIEITSPSIPLNSLGHIDARVHFFPFKITLRDRDSTYTFQLHRSTITKERKPITLPNYHRANNKRVQTEIVIKMKEYCH